MARGWVTRSYNFINKDPIIDRLRGMWQDEHIKESELAVVAGVHPGTVSKLFGGETKKPQFATVAKLTHAMGYEHELVRSKGGKPDYEKEVPIARSEYKAHKEALRKKREKGNGKKRP
jgi:hypothetical protein